MASSRALLLIISIVVLGVVTGAESSNIPLCPSVTTSTTATTTSCTDPARATSAAYDCMTNHKCQQNFDAVSRCFGSNTPDILEWDESQTAAIHCCLCENFIFSLAKTWDVCAQCVQAIHDDLGVADNLTQPWANVQHAQAIFCDRPQKDRLQAFARAFRDVATVWDQFASFNPVGQGFVLNTCDTSTAPATAPPTPEAPSPAVDSTVPPPSTQPVSSSAQDGTSSPASGPLHDTMSDSSTQSTGQAPTATPSPSINAWTGRSDGSVATVKLFGVLLCITGAAYAVADQWV